MGGRIALCGILTCWSLAVSASALTVDDYVAAGRAALFERTQAGLLAACDVFSVALEDTGCPDCRSDRELAFFHAIAQTAQLFVDNRDVLSTEDFFDLAAVLGIPLDRIVWCDARVAEASETEASCQASIEMVRQRLSETVLGQLEAIVTTLNAIEDGPDPFVVYLVPEETGLASDLEVDYSDVLIFKGLLSAYRGFLATQMAHAPVLDEAGSAMFRDDAEMREETLLEYVDQGRLLSELTDGNNDASLLAQARTDWIDALAWTVSATERMGQEDCPAGSDPQEDEFVYVDAEAQAHLEAYRRMLSTLRLALADGVEATASVKTVRTYDLYTTDAKRAGVLSLVFDLSRTEGCSGRLVLTDGTTLEVDWFGRFGEGRIGVSMFSASENLEGWLEVTLDADLGMVRDGTLDLWGARSVAMAGLAGRIADPQSDMPEPALASTAGLLVPISPLWLAFGQAETLLVAD